MKLYADPFSRLIGRGVLDAARALSILRIGSPRLHRLVLRHMGMDYPDSRALTRVTETALAHQISLDDMQTIGWPRLRLITHEMTSSNRDALIALGRTLPVEVLANALGLPLYEPCEHVLTLRLTLEQWRRLSQLLVLNGAEQTPTGLYGAETALMQAIDPVFPVMH